MHLGGEALPFPEGALEEIQGVPGYGPQAAAMHALPLAAHLSSTARGPIQNRDVGSGKETI